MKKTVFSILLGTALGTIDAIVLLSMLASSGFMMNTGRFLLCFAAGCALPLCADVLRSGRTFHVLTVQLTMILVSFLISLGYGSYVSHASLLARAYADIFTRVWKCCGTIQAAAAAVCLLTERMAGKRAEK